MPPLMYEIVYINTTTRDLVKANKVTENMTTSNVVNTNKLNFDGKLFLKKVIGLGAN